MANSSSSSSSGIGFVGLLTVVFVTLKLTHVIDWSWWWVLAPVWIDVVLMIAFFIIGFIVMFAAEFFTARKKAKDAASYEAFKAKRAELNAKLHDDGYRV